jgi:hypothetical protein
MASPGAAFGVVVANVSLYAFVFLGLDRMLWRSTGLTAFRRHLASAVLSVEVAVFLWSDASLARPLAAFGLTAAAASGWLFLRLYESRAGS